MRVWIAGVVVGVLTLVQLGGCATIRNEKFKEVEFTSEPSGAWVALDDEVMGVTPCVVEIARKGRDKVVEIALDGYKTVRLNLDRSVEGKTIFGGLIGMSVDAVSGKAGTYSDSVHIVMEVGEGEVEVDSGELDQKRKERGGDSGN